MAWSKSGKGSYNGPVGTHNESRPGARSPEYQAWLNMNGRCNKTSKNPVNHRYKARDIGVCDRWTKGENGMTGYECFLADMGRKPFSNLTLDRMDNEAGYFPENCRWTDRKTQQRNRSNTCMVNYSGRMISLMELADKFGLKKDDLRYRMRRRGMSAEEAVRNCQEHPPVRKR